MVTRLATCNLCGHAVGPSAATQDLVRETLQQPQRLQAQKLLATAWVCVEPSCVDPDPTGPTGLSARFCLCEPCSSRPKIGGLTMPDPHDHPVRHPNGQLHALYRHCAPSLGIPVVCSRCKKLGKPDQTYYYSCFQDRKCSDFHICYGCFKKASDFGLRQGYMKPPPLNSPDLNTYSDDGKLLAQCAGPGSSHITGGQLDAPHTQRGEAKRGEKLHPHFRSMLFFLSVRQKGMGHVPAIDDYDSDSAEANFQSDSDDEERRSSSSAPDDVKMKDDSSSSSSSKAAKRGGKKKRRGVKSATTHKSSASSRRRAVEPSLLADEGDAAGVDAIKTDPESEADKALFKEYQEMISWMHLKQIRDCMDLRFFPHAHVVYHPDDAHLPQHQRRVHKLELGASVGDFGENGTHTSYELPYVHLRLHPKYKMCSAEKLVWRPDLEEADDSKPHELPAGALSCTWMDIVDGKISFPREFHLDHLKRLRQAGLPLPAVHIYRRFMAYRCVAHVRCVLPWLDSLAEIKDIWDKPGMEKMCEPIVLARPPLTNRDFLYLYKFYPWTSDAPWFFRVPPRCVAHAQPSVDLYGRDLHEAQQSQLPLAHSMGAPPPHAAEVAKLNQQMRDLASQQSAVQKRLDQLLPSLQLPVGYMTENKEQDWTSEEDKQLLRDYETLFPQETPPNWVQLAEASSRRGRSRQPSTVRSRFMYLQSRRQHSV